MEGDLHNNTNLFTSNHKCKKIEQKRYVSEVISQLNVKEYDNGRGSLSLF